jgi:hypothetical protein
VKRPNPERDTLHASRFTLLQECAKFSEFSIHVVTVFGMPAIEMHLKSLGHRLDVMSKAFDHDSRVPLDLFSRGSNLVAEVSRRSGNLLAEAGDVAAQALSGCRHNPFNLGKGFGIHGCPPCGGCEV